MIELIVILAAIVYGIGAVFCAFGAVLTWSTSDVGTPQHRREERAEAARLLRMAPIWPLVLLRTLLMIASHKEDDPNV